MDEFCRETKLPQYLKLKIHQALIHNSNQSIISEDEKKAAQEVKIFVSNLILNKYIRLENIKNEKYGRILADVYIGNIHLNDLLLQNRYAVVYNGGTKIKPTSWSNYKTTGIM